jgi:hypothetical protein
MFICCRYKFCYCKTVHVAQNEKRFPCISLSMYRMSCYKINILWLEKRNNISYGLRFSQQFLCMLPSSGIHRRVVCMWTIVSEECITSIFRAENQLSKKPACSRIATLVCCVVLCDMCICVLSHCSNTSTGYKPSSSSNNNNKNNNKIHLIEIRWVPSSKKLHSIMLKLYVVNHVERPPRSPLSRLLDHYQNVTM